MSQDVPMTTEPQTLCPGCGAPQPGPCHADKPCKPWDGYPERDGGWHLLRQIAKPEYGIPEKDVPWFHQPGHIAGGTRDAVCPWIRPNISGPDHCYAERHMGRDWQYIGPMEVSGA